MDVINTYRNLLKTFSFADFLMIEDHKEGALRKDPVLEPFVGQLQTTTLKNLTDNFH